MPRGRHRHSPSLHRLLPPAVVAAFGLACAGGAWLVGDPGLGDSDTVLLRGFAAAAALAGVSGAALAWRWDRSASRRLAELKTRLASTEWRAEERRTDLEGDLAEARKLREALEAKVGAKRTELAGLRTEHAALLRRYAQAEAGRASALERRRLLEIEAAAPAPALTVDATDHRAASGAPTPLTYLQASEALRHLKRNGVRQRELRAAAEEARAQAEEKEPAEQEPQPQPQPQPRSQAQPLPPAVAALAPRPALPQLPAERSEGGGFDFFGASSGGNGTSSDGNGEAKGRPPAPGLEPATAPRPRTPGAGKVIDLSEPDEDEELDASRPRGAN